jgi:hypothetical protein
MRASAFTVFANLDHFVALKWVSIDSISQNMN